MLGARNLNGTGPKHIQIQNSMSTRYAAINPIPRENPKKQSNPTERIFHGLFVFSTSRNEAVTRAVRANSNTAQSI